MKLVSMVDYVIQSTKPFETVDDIDYYREILLSYGKIKNYAKFLKQPLKLEMFVPCDDEGKHLEDPELTMMQGDGQIYYGASEEEFEQYKKAQEKVLFKGFDVKDSVMGSYLLIYGGGINLAEYLFVISETIEGLIRYFSGIELTENAIKQLK